jgi:hypothetical protein
MKVCLLCIHPRHPICPECGVVSTGLFSQGYGGGFPPGGYGGGGPGLRCQLGHDIAAGASYCPQGHPVALDAMPFGGGDGQYAPPPPQQGFAPPYPNQGYAPPQPQQPPYGGGGGYDPQQPQQGFAPPPYPGPGPGPGQLGQPAQQPQGAPGGYAPPVYAPPQGPPQGQQQAYGQQPQGYSPPGQQQGFGSAAPHPGAGGGYQPAPPGGLQGQAGPAYEPPPAQPANLPANALRAFLVGYQTNAAGEFWALTGGRHAIGRANSGLQVDIPLSDATISSKHAAISVDVASNTVFVEDTSSTNGTYVNEEHIGFGGRRDLRDGDRIRFGGYSTIVKIVAR